MHFYDFSKHTEQEITDASKIATAVYKRNPNYLQKLLHKQSEDKFIKSYVDENGNSRMGDLGSLTYEMLLISVLKYPEIVSQEKLLLTSAWRRLIEYSKWMSRIKRVEITKFASIGRSDITDEFYRHSQILEEINSDEEVECGI